jgi:adenylate cyclase
VNYLLVVDDEESVRRSLKRALEREGYGVLLAENGDRAIELIKSRPQGIETVISDFRMPGKDGLQTLTEVRKLNPEITRIMLTGYATMETAIESLNEGVDGFLMKPFSNSDLRAKIREYTLKKRLRQFVSDQVYERMQQGFEWMKFRRCPASVLFCDIRGFSRMSEEISKEELSFLLNSGFFSPLDDIVCEHGGMLDKHIGDSIMAVFGVLADEDKAARQAVNCARKMIEQMSRETVSGDTTSISVGIGIGSGEVMAGLFGSARKKEYTVFGSPVNVAARLEGMARSGEILICEQTGKMLGDDPLLHPLEAVQLKGMDREIMIFRVANNKQA